MPLPVASAARIARSVSPLMYGRPRCLPSARARAMPARTRSWIIALSNSAKTPSISHSARPAGAGASQVLRRPIFAVAASRDHVAPWRSVYKLHLQSDATELTFVLTSGGHNVGIVNEPGHPRRSYQVTTCREGERVLDAETWKATAPKRE